MQIAPVNYRNLVPRLDYLVVTKVEPTGHIDMLRVTPDLTVQVEHHDGHSHRFVLDAGQAEDLIHALGMLAESPVPAIAPGHASRTRFDIELGWHGRTVRLHGVESAEDDAVQGVLGFARSVFQDAHPRLQPRRQPATPQP